VKSEILPLGTWVRWEENHGTHVKSEVSQITSYNGLNYYRVQRSDGQFASVNKRIVTQLTKKQVVREILKQ